VAAHEGRLRGLGVAGELEGLESWHQLPEQRSELHAGELGAQAEVDAIARATFAAVYGFAVIAAAQPELISAAEIRRFITAIIPFPRSEMRGTR